MNHSFVFLGCLPKRLVQRPEWLKCPNVDFVASVSECISPAPPNRIDHWKHNDVGLYDTEALAMSIVAPDDDVDYTLFTYSAFPAAFHAKQKIDWNPWKNNAPATLDAAYDEHLGFDIVGFSNTGFFECSPLSCNGVAGENGVNRFCLVDDLERAVAIAKNFSADDSRVEPAWAYVVIDVRKRMDKK